MKIDMSSFRDLFGDGRRVEIPVIQRDYAQGRDDEHSREVRRRFVEALAKALSPEQTLADKTALDLDFIYGKWKVAEKTLEPLDGQQRLTTLFLLHWYLASLDGTFDEFRAWITIPSGSAFTYWTRPAAREFFDALVQRPAPLPTIIAKSRALSWWVADSVWFVRSWWRDPTVRGCLTMLDALHERFAATKGAWRRLVSRESPAIMFRLLLLENFALSDELYVKMNARGKALTSFEVFKAEFDRFVGETFGEGPCPYSALMGWREHVSRQFDTTWTDFVWNHRGETTEIDSKFMHFIRAVAVARCVDLGNDARLPEQVDRLLANSEPGVPFYEEIGCLDKDFVEQLIRVLDTLSAREEAPSFIGRADYLDEKVLLRRVFLARSANQADGLTLVDWVMFYAWCAFVVRFSTDISGDAVRAAFHDWIRVVANLAHNSNIDRNERLVGALRGLRRLAGGSGVDFLSRVANGALDESGGFNQQQQREERLKAQLILRNAKWRPLIERAETHPYFRGDVEFLLRFSGVFDKAMQAGRCDWNDDDDAALRQLFAEWYERARTVFPDDTATWPGRLPNFVWERALLATGDYLLPRGRNWSLLDDKDRDASWKRLLRADTQIADREARRDVVRRVLEQIDTNDVVGSLQAIIAGGVQGDDTTPVPGFRKRLVDEPRLIEYCSLRMLRTEDDSAFLLRRAQRNGYHVDLYVYDLYLRLKGREAELAPFDRVDYTQVTGYLPSTLRLQAANPGFSLTAKKQGADMQLHLQLQASSPQVVTGLTGWTADGEVSLRRSVSPDAAEQEVISLAKFLRACVPEPAATDAVAVD